MLISTLISMRVFKENIYVSFLNKYIVYFCHGFSPLTHKERAEHWAYQIKDTKVLDLLDGIDLY